MRAGGWRAAEKLRAGADFAVSQLFFDVREYEALVEDLRAKGLNVPVVPGILPIQSFDSLRPLQKSLPVVKP